MHDEPPDKFPDIDPDELRLALEQAGVEGKRMGKATEQIANVAGWLEGEPDEFVHGPADGGRWLVP